MREQILKIVCAAFLASMLVAVAFVEQASAECRIDWNHDGVVAEADYLAGDPIGGYYAEWYIFQYYPAYYPVLFPDGDTAALDFNGDSLVDQDDLMGPLDAVLQTEGFYVEWYIYMFYDAYYGIFIPESTCGPKGMAVTNSAVMAGAPFYAHTSSVLFYSVSRDGSLIAGKTHPVETAVVFNTVDYMANPSDKSYYEYLGTEEVVRVQGISTDKNIIVADLRDQAIDSASLIWAGYYDRTAGVWTTLPKPLPSEDYCCTGSMGPPRVVGISADGTKVLGNTAGVVSWGLYTGFVYDILTDTYSFLYPVDDTKGVFVEKISDDGSIVVGQADNNPAVWTRQPDGTYTVQYKTPIGAKRILDVSADGQYYVHTDYGSFNVYDPIGTTVVSTSSTYPPRRGGLSDDGGVFVATHGAGLGYTDPFIWRDGFGYQLLETYMSAAGAPVSAGFDPGRFAPFDLSSEGTVFVGFADNLGTQYGFVGVADPGI